MAEIVLSDVRKSYGKTEVVHGVNLDIAHGELVVILGPSGCGKSTLLRMVAGLEAITAGEIAIDGTVVNKLEPRERGCAMVFQNYALYPHMSVADNIGYALKIAGLAKPARLEKVRQVAALAGPDRIPRPQARPALRRPAPARRHGARHDPRAEGLPLRRAALQSGRAAARRHARRNPQAASTARRHHAVRHARPGRGDDAGRPHRRHEQGRGRTGRHAGRGLRPARRRLMSPAS